MTILFHWFYIKYTSHPRVQSDGATADEGHVNLARLDGLARLDERDEGRAAGGVDVHGGAVEVEEEGCRKSFFVW